MGGTTRVTAAGGNWIELYDTAPFTAAKMAANSASFLVLAAALVPVFKAAWAMHKSARDEYDVQASVHLSPVPAPYMSRYGVINDRMIVAEHPHILSIEYGHEKVVPKRVGTGSKATTIMVHTGEWVPGLHVMRDTARRIGLFKKRRG